MSLVFQKYSAGATSWNDLTDKPFYDETLAPITWDGNTEGREVLDMGGTFTLVKVSDEFFTAEQLTGAIIGVSNGGQTEIPANRVVEGLVGEITVIQVEGILMSFSADIAHEVVTASKGTYFADYASAGYDYSISSLIFPSQVKKLDEKYLPAPTFIAGSSDGSLRTATAKAEDDNYTMGMYALAEGYETTASSESSHAEGSNTEASGLCSHAEGYETTASGAYGHAEGWGTTARSQCSHAEGEKTEASGLCSHAEGSNTEASGNYSHAEGWNTTASGDYGHAEGYKTTASGNAGSHAEGYKTTASGLRSHAEGYETTASGDYGHAEGWGTTARSQCSHAQGKYNIEDTANKYAHIVGNGSASGRSNAHTLDWDGNAWFAGGLELTSPNGTRYRFTVSDDGTLSATVVTE